MDIQQRTVHEKEAVMWCGRGRGYIMLRKQTVHHFQAMSYFALVLDRCDLWELAKTECRSFARCPAVALIVFLPVRPSYTPGPCLSYPFLAYRQARWRCPQRRRAYPTPLFWVPLCCSRYSARICDTKSDTWLVISFRNRCKEFVIQNFHILVAWFGPLEMYQYVQSRRSCRTTTLSR